MSVQYWLKMKREAYTRVFIYTVAGRAIAAVAVTNAGLTISDTRGRAAFALNLQKETVSVIKLSGKRTHPKSIVIFASKTSTALRIVVKLTNFPDRITRTLSGGQHDTCEGSSSGSKRGENVEDFHGCRYQKSLRKTFLLNVGSSE